MLLRSLSPLFLCTSSLYSTISFHHGASCVSPTHSSPCIAVSVPPDTFFPPSFSSNIHKHSATQSRETRAKRQRHRNIITQLLQRRRDGRMNSHLLWPQNFCPTPSHFGWIRTGVMLLLSLLSSPRGCERLKPKLAVTKSGMQKPTTPVSQLYGC